MTTITKNLYGTRQFGSSINTFGNVIGLRYNLTTTATGAVADSDTVTTPAVQVGDIIRIGIIPGGVTLFDLTAIISTGMTASTTGKLGFAYVDGVDSTAVPQDDDYFIPAGQALDSAAIVRKTALTAPVKLPKDAWLILTTAGAINVKVSVLDFIVFGEQGGTA
jgi:hypothetical protein